MPRLANLLIAISLASLTASPVVGDEGLEPVRFMAGAWGNDGEIIEYWLPPLRGLMVGINRDPKGDEMPFFEFLRLEARSDGIVYVASPRGGGTTEFRLTEVSAGRAVFENPQHDFPQKIIYTRAGDRLEAEVGAVRDGEWGSFTSSWSRVSCASGPSDSASDETR